jgi:hypothetical protein
VADADKDRLEMEKKLAELISSIPLAPRTAFQMYAEEKLDALAVQGPLPDAFDAESMQKLFVQQFNALPTEQQAGYHTRGLEKFQLLMQSAHESIREVGAFAVCACSGSDSAARRRLLRWTNQGRPTAAASQCSRLQ